MGDLVRRSPILETVYTKEKEHCMRHLLRRTGFYLVALWASITLNFIIPRLIPGDPTAALMARFQGQHVDNDTINTLRIQFGISNEPVLVQYVKYLNNLLHGNLG